MSDKLIDQLGAQGAIAQAVIAQAVTRLLRPSMERLAMTVDDLMQQIKETERLIAVYRNASEVVVGTQDEVRVRSHPRRRFAPMRGGAHTFGGDSGARSGSGRILPRMPFKSCTLGDNG